MKQYEKHLEEAWRELVKRRKVTYTFKEMDKITEAFIKAFNKIQQQREELEQSRDNWRKRFEEVMRKSKKNLI